MTPLFINQQLNPDCLWILTEPFIARRVYEGVPLRNTKAGWQWLNKGTWQDIYDPLSFKQILKEVLFYAKQSALSSFPLVKEFESARLLDGEDYPLGEYTLYWDKEWLLVHNLSAPQVSNIQSLEVTDGLYAQFKKEMALMRKTVYGVRLDSLVSDSAAIVLASDFDWS